MARLLDALRGSSQRYSLADYAQQMASFIYNGHLYTPPYTQTAVQGQAEQIQHHFEGMVRSAYYDNGIVFACMLARRAVFSQGRFQWRQLRSGKFGDYFGNPDLDILQMPWFGAGTDDLLGNAIDHADLGGNAYIFREDGTADELVMLRPDWTDIMLERRRLRGGNLGWKKLGFAYYENGDRTARPVPLRLEEVAHWAPIKDPLATYRGMSWITPVAREVAGDKAASAHKLKFFEQGATPNMIVKVSETMSFEDFKEFMEVFEGDVAGAQNAYKTLFLGGGADVEVVGKDFQQIDFKVVQGAGETRIAAAAGTPPVIVGLSEGLAGSSLNTGNYGAARRNFADRTLRDLWTSVSTSLQTIVPAPGGAALAVDPRNVPFLSEDAEVQSKINQTDAITFRNLMDAGVEFESAKKVVATGDITLAEDTGLQSVQLQNLNAEQQPTDGGGPPDDSNTPAA